MRQLARPPLPTVSSMSTTMQSIDAFYPDANEKARSSGSFSEGAG
jgi:hypothetical protein